MGSSSVIRWMVFYMMTHAPLTWASEINCYFNGQVIGSHRQISWARNVENRHRFCGARALGSWQSIQIACRLQKSVQEDTGRRMNRVSICRMDRARCEKPHTSKLVNISQLRIPLLLLVHLWLVEITCRLECMHDVMSASDINLWLQ